VAVVASTVDDEQADRALDRRQDTGREVVVGQAFRRDQQHIHGVPRERLLDLRPLLAIPRMDRRRPEAQAAGHRDLVAHECEERADDQGRTVARVAADPRGDPVDEALAPAGALDDECARSVGDDRLDRVALPVAEGRAGPEHRLEVALEGVEGRVEGRVGGLHLAKVRMPSRVMATRGGGRGASRDGTFARRSACLCLNSDGHRYADTRIRWKKGLFAQRARY
jgi:hypothetical protein